MPAWPNLLDAEDQKPSIPTTSAGISSGSSTRYSPGPADSDIEIVDPPPEIFWIKNGHALRTSPTLHLEEK